MQAGSARTSTLLPSRASTIEHYPPLAVRQRAARAPGSRSTQRRCHQSGTRLRSSRTSSADYFFENLTVFRQTFFFCFFFSIIIFSTASLSAPPAVHLNLTNSKIAYLYILVYLYTCVKCMRDRYRASHRLCVIRRAVAYFVHHLTNLVILGNWERN